LIHIIGNRFTDFTDKELKNFWEHVLKSEGLALIGNRGKVALIRKEKSDPREIYDDYDSHWDRGWTSMELEQLAKERWNELDTTT